MKQTTVVNHEQNIKATRIAEFARQIQINKLGQKQYRKR